MADKEGINWNELRVACGAPRQWKDHDWGKLAVARMHNAAAVAYANYGRGGLHS